jgi:hypothetical protein
MRVEVVEDDIDLLVGIGGDDVIHDSFIMIHPS